MDRYLFGHRVDRPHLAERLERAARLRQLQRRRQPAEPLAPVPLRRDAQALAEGPRDAARRGDPGDRLPVSRAVEAALVQHDNILFACWRIRFFFFNFALLLVRHPDGAEDVPPRGGY